MCEIKRTLHLFPPLVFGFRVCPPFNLLDLWSILRGICQEPCFAQGPPRRVSLCPPLFPFHCYPCFCLYFLRNKRKVITPPGHICPRSAPLSPLYFPSYRSPLHRSSSGYPCPFPPHLSPLCQPSFLASMLPLLTSLPFLSLVL
jgi:hypothetical protein